MQHPETASELLESGSHRDEPSRRIVELLDGKRKQLDQEIADFKSKKEKEYKVYEQQLRSWDGRQAAGQDIVTLSNGEANSQVESQLVNDDLKQNVAKLHKTAQGDGVEKILNSTNGSKRGENRHPERIDMFKEPGSIAEGRSNAPSHLVPSTPSHDREMEFRGLFTPSYLPLLDGPNQSHAQVEAGRRIPSALSRSSSTPSLSSSATLPTTTITPLLPSPDHRRLSASVPRQKPPHRRTSSSRSDNSITSLRSSLRDRRQPRSPKRVLFSIDNTVVSPNSSPIARRSMPILLPPPSVTDVPHEPAQEEEEDHGSVHEIEDAPNKSEYPSLAFEQILNTTPSTSLASCGRQLLEPTTTSPVVGGADFEDVDTDDNPLFAFDEDIDLRYLEDDESEKV